MNRSANPFARLQTPRAGRCGICCEPALLTHIDNPTGLRFGRCCYLAIISAEALILCNRQFGGPRAPLPGELRLIDNY